MSRPVYIHEFSVACALGDTVDTVRRNLLSETPKVVCGTAGLLDGRTVPVGSIEFELAGGKSSADTFCNRLADHCLNEMGAAVDREKARVGADRIAVIVGTSTSGVREVGKAFSLHEKKDKWPENFRFGEHELGDVAAHVARRIGAGGPAYGISTACTSGAKALASAARLIQTGLCDVVIAGGVDSLCDLTLNGFSSLDSLPESICNPFSINRRGITLGEGAALFILSAQPSDICLAGWGESADAHHISAPDPEGVGAMLAMRTALDRAGCRPQDIGYLNLHGTGTKLNDQMEALAVSEVFGADLPCSSSKPMTGHMLGAAGACEAAFTIMALTEGRLPAHIWDGEYDPALTPIRLVADAGETTNAKRAMSSSYAFGGNNIALILELAE